MPQTEVQKILQRHAKLKNLKTPWMPLYQALATYIYLRKQYFTIDYMLSPFMLNFVYDSTAVHSAHMMAASLIGQIMPNPYECFEFVPEVAQGEDVDDDTYDFFGNVNKVMPNVLSNPESGLMNALHESILDGGVFGTGAVVVDETNDFATPIRYYSYDAKILSIDENQYGKVDTIYAEKLSTVGKLVQEFGYTAVSKRTQKLYDADQFDEQIKLLWAIEPRRERNPMSLGNLDMPWASRHIEIDQDLLLKESGFNELPIIVWRFWKNVNEIQGRSPAMDALADIRALNRLVEMYEKTGEMGLNPPRVISTEDILGAGKIPWGPGAEIPLHMSSRLGTDRRPPIELLPVTQNPSWALERIAVLQENIKDYFMVNYLTDLNNTSRQTATEANIRDEKGLFITGSILNRCLTELLGPVLDRSFNILLSKGYFGVVRGSVQDYQMQAMGIQPKYIAQDFISKRMSGFKGYRLNFISPAARLMKLEQLQGERDLTQYAIQTASLVPSILDNLNFDQLIRNEQKLGGSSGSVINSIEKVRQIRQARDQQDAQQQQMQEQALQSEMLKRAGSGIKDIANASAA